MVQRQDWARNKWRKRHGQSMVEAAIVLPIFLLVLLGILDFGWILSNQLMVNNGSRDGARLAIVKSDDPNMITLVTDRVHTNPGLQSLSDVTVTVTKDPTGTDIRVTVVKKVQVLTPLAGVFAQGQVLDLTATTVMRIE